MSAETPANQPPAKTSNGFKIATVVLAITTVIGLVWGGIMTSKFNSEQDANTSATSQIAGDGTELAKLRQELGIDDKKIAEDNKNLANEVAAVKQLRAKYDDLQKTDNSLQAQVTVANAKASLAAQCASILAAGYEALHKDVSNGVTYKDISDQLKQAAPACKGVVNFQPLTP